MKGVAGNSPIQLGHQKNPSDPPPPPSPFLLTDDDDDGDDDDDDVFSGRGGSWTEKSVRPRIVVRFFFIWATGNLNIASFPALTLNAGAVKKKTVVYARRPSERERERETWFFNE